MNDERAMILKMLQEGKISVEEADALLDVLNEAPAGEEGGFSKVDAGGHGESASPGPAPASNRAGEGGAGAGDPRHPGPGGTHSEGGARGPGAGTGGEGRHHGPGADHGIRFDFDVSGLSDTLRSAMGSVREAMQGVGASLKDAVSGLGDLDLDLGPEFARAMGRERADAERELRAATGPTGTFTVSNKWGDVRVTGVDAQEIVGTAHVTCWAGDEAAAREAVDHTVILMQGDADRWEIASELSLGNATRIDYELTVPRGFSVEVTTASGDLWLEDLAGSQTVNTMSGDVNVASLGSGAGDRQSVSTKSGDVIGAALAGEITLGSLSGDVSVNGFAGLLRVSTKSGDIQVSGGRGSVELKAMSGDVRAELLEIGAEPVRISSVSGDAELHVPVGASLDVDARSVSGDAEAKLELEDASRGEHRVTGKANGGAVRTELSSVSGDVRIWAV